MPLGNGGGAIAITDTSNSALPCCVFGNGALVRVIPDAVGLKIRGVPGVPQHWTEGVLDANGRYTTIQRHVTGAKACYDPEDIQYAFLSMHTNTCTRVCSTIFLAMSSQLAARGTKERAPLGWQFFSGFFFLENYNVS